MIINHNHNSQSQHIYADYSFLMTEIYDVFISTNIIVYIYTLVINFVYFIHSLVLHAISQNVLIF